MAIRISRATYDAMVIAAAIDPVHEVCGIVFGADIWIDSFELTANVADDQSQRFEIDPVALIAAHRAARLGMKDVIGYFHSHPHGPAIPSVTDESYACGDGKLWLIAGQGVIRAWRAMPHGFLEEAIDIIENLALFAALRQRAFAITGKAGSHDHK